MNDPHQPIVAHLTRSREEPESVGRSGAGWTATAGGHGPFPQPWTVELHDPAGGLVRSHPFHGGRPR